MINNVNIYELYCVGGGDCWCVDTDGNCPFDYSTGSFGKCAELCNSKGYVSFIYKGNKENEFGGKCASAIIATAASWLSGGHPALASLVSRAKGLK